MAAKYKVVVQKPSGGITYDLADLSLSHRARGAGPHRRRDRRGAGEDGGGVHRGGARTPTRVIARNRRISAAIIKGLRNCKVDRARQRGRRHRGRGRRHRGGHRGHQRPRRLHRRGGRPHHGHVPGRPPPAAADAPAHGGREVDGGPALLQGHPAPLRPDHRPHLLRQRGQGGGPPLPCLRPARDRLRSVPRRARDDGGGGGARHQPPRAVPAARTSSPCTRRSMPRRIT